MSGYMRLDIYTDGSPTCLPVYMYIRTVVLIV